MNTKCKNRKKKNEFFLEQYEVNLDYKKADGYWVHSYCEEIMVPIKHGKNEKCNHDIAAQMAKKLYNKTEHRINCVTYC